MHPYVALALLGVLLITGLILGFIAIVYFIGKRMQRVHTRREPEDKEEMLESHLEGEPEDKKERFDVKYNIILDITKIPSLIINPVKSNSKMDWLVSSNTPENTAQSLVGNRVFVSIRYP
jgi:cytidylate kinase